MKKLYKIFFVSIMSLMLVACGNGKTNDDTFSVEEETEEGFVTEETEEETVTEETEEEAVKEETKTTEYQLTQMNSGFYGGIAWATVADNTGAKKVLINKELQVVYELPEGMQTGDIFDGKAVVINSDQAGNPGFMIIGADGTVLYECADNLTGKSYPGYNINFTRDGNTIYERKESGLTANTVFACILDDKFERIAEIEIPGYSDYNYWIDNPRFYYYLSDGVYCSSAKSNDNINSGEFILNLKEHEIYSISIYSDSSIDIAHDMDRCAGIRLYNYENKCVTVVNAEDIDYSEITDKETLENLAAANGKTYNVDFYGSDYMSNGFYYNADDYNEEKTAVAFNHGFFDFTLQNGSLKETGGIVLPDFGAEIRSFRLSNDGKYIALQLNGADGNTYYTVIKSDGQKLYDPVTSELIEQIESKCNIYPNYVSWYEGWGVCDGYIMYADGIGITPDGKVFQLGDGTILSGIGGNSLLCFFADASNEIIVSDGYIVCQSKLYKSDGTEVTTLNVVN